MSLAGQTEKSLGLWASLRLSMITGNRAKKLTHKLTHFHIYLKIK